MSTDLKISQLTVETAIQDADVLPIVDVANSITKKTTWANIKSVLLTYLATLFVDFATIQTLTNKILGTGTKITLGSDATGDTYYRNASGNLVRLAIGSTNQIQTVIAGIPSWQPAPTASNGSTTAAGVYEEAIQAEVDAKTTVGSTGADLAVNPSTLRSTKANDGVADTGSANTYVITPSPAITAYATYQEFTVKIANANTSSTVTLNVNGLGAKNVINPDGSSLSINQLYAGGIFKFIYDGTNFQLGTSASGAMIIPQKIGNQTGFSATFASADIAGLSPTNRIYIAYAKSATAPIIITSKILGGIFISDKAVSTSGFTSGSSVSVAVVGSFVYVQGGLTGSEVLNRYDINTLANPTTMTVSGTSFSSAVPHFSDGTKLYAVGASNTVTPYTISGTTATSGGNITFTGITTTDGVWCDGTFVYQSYTSGNLNRWPLAGGSATALTQYYTGGSTALGVIKQAGNTLMSYAFAGETIGAFVQPVTYQ